jgi:hypothetical protein
MSVMPMIALLAALWFVVSLLAVGVCRSAAEGDRCAIDYDGWLEDEALEAEVLRVA